MNEYRSSIEIYHLPHPAQIACLQHEEPSPCPHYTKLPPFVWQICASGQTAEALSEGICPGAHIATQKARHTAGLLKATIDLIIFPARRPPVGTGSRCLPHPGRASALCSLRGAHCRSVPRSRPRSRADPPKNRSALPRPCSAA